MAKAVLLIGNSGTGKSTSLENLEHESTFIINVKNKSLPFRGWKQKYTQFDSAKNTGNYVSTDQANQVLAVLGHISKSMPHIKVIVIDDFQYIAASDFMARVSETGFAKFNTIGKNIYTLAEAYTKLRDDLTVVYMCHAEEVTDADGSNKSKAKTVGKLVDTVLTLEGLYTVVLFTEVVKGKDKVDYYFRTQNNGSNTGKSPRGMFDSLLIPNDLKLVVDAVQNYDN